MDNISCIICGAKYSSYKSLHLHIGRKEPFSLEEYYHKFYPRYDLHTKELIKFTNRDKYFQTLFNTKKNLVNWFKETDCRSLKKSVTKILIENRIKEKNIKYAFSQSELRTSALPSIPTLQKLFDDESGYLSLCEQFGLINKYDYFDTSNLDLTNRDIKILIDTREQKPLTFDCESKIKQLNCGDYTADEPDYDDIYIERKSPEDFFGTFGTSLGFERFTKEVKRAKDYGFYLFVLIESSIDAICNFNHRWANNSQNTILCSLANMRSLCQNYENIQFLFASDRNQSSDLIKKILQNKKKSTNFDWQYLIDCKIC